MTLCEKSWTDSKGGTVLVLEKQRGLVEVFFYQGRDKMAFRLIDFHSHYYASEWYASATPIGTSVLSRAWPLLTDINAQIAALDAAAIDAKVLTAPISVLVDTGQTLSETRIRQINDTFAEMVKTHPGRLLALATIDPFQEERAAREVERAITTLGLSGICLDCSQAGRFLNIPEARPTFEAASALGIPVFIHPVSPAGLTERLASLGHTGVLLARGTENAASVLTLLQSDLLSDLPELKIVIPMIGIAALIFAGIADQEYTKEERWRGKMLPSLRRKQLYIDTMGFDVATIRFAIELLGYDHVLFGSDWPIMPITPRKTLEQIVTELELNEEQATAILGGNTERLLVHHVPS